MYKNFNVNISYEKIFEKFKLEANKSYAIYSDIEKFERSIYNKNIYEEYKNTINDILLLNSKNNIKSLEKKKLSNLKIYINKLEKLKNHNN